MSASNEGRARSRLSLLAGSSLVAATIVLSAGGVALTPTAAWALNECVPVGTDPADNGSAADTFACAGSYSATGITYSSAGALTVNATGSMNVGANGLNLTGNGADSVTLTATGTITGTGGPVIDVNSALGGAGPINITTAGVTGTASNVTYGINATSQNGASISISATGAVNVTSNSAAAQQQSAIRAVTNGAGAINIDTGSTVTGRLRGIEATASGTGALTITAAGVVNAHATAGVANIDATTGTGLLTVNLSDAALIAGFTMSGNGGAAIRTSAGGDAVINIGFNRTVTANSLSAGILDLTATGATTVNNAGFLGALGGTVGNTASVAIRATGGAFTLNNDNELMGALDLAGVTGAVSVKNAGTWTARGTSTFGSGESVLRNSGIVVARFATTTFTGLDTFENSGTVEFGIDRDAASHLLSAPGTALVGSGDSQLLMEVMLGTAGQADCSATVVADCFSLVGGSTSGVTSILVKALGPITTELNTAGIVLVDVNGGESHAGDFVLDSATIGYVGDSVYGGVISTDGLLGFALQYDEDNQRHYLGSVVPGNRLEYVAALQEVVSIWHTTSDTIAGRQADLRDGDERGFWARASGERTTRDVELSFTASGTDFHELDEYELETATVIGGMDLVSGDGFVFGIHGGGVKSKLERATSATTDQLDGVTAGVYGGWWSESGLTLDGTLNGNFLKLDHDRPVEEVSSTNIISIGARGEAGWKFAVGETFYVQPLTTAAYVRTEIKELFQAGFDASYDDISSLRAALGLRVGGDAGAVGWWASGRAWKEFAGEGTLTLGTIAEDVVITDDLAGEFQELAAGVSLSNAGDTLQGYLSGGAKFGDDTDSYSASFGLRLRW